MTALDADDDSKAISRPGTAGCGCGCVRKGASATRCRAITTSRNTSPPISTAQACAAIPKGRCSARWPQHRPADAHSPATGERLRDDPPARRGGRDRNQARQSQLPGDRDHRLSQEWRHARKGSGKNRPGSTHFCHSTLSRKLTRLPEIEHRLERLRARPARGRPDRLADALPGAAASLVLVERWLAAGTFRSFVCIFKL